MSETVRDTTNNKATGLLIEDFGFEQVFESAYASVLVNKERKILACILLADYVPIRQFKETFEQLSGVVDQNNIEKFIFDKRSLRTFHQPSMEWYYIEWKTKMLEKGMSLHRKILPDLKWFVKAVEIAKRPLLNKMPQEVRERLDIAYCDTLDQAVNS